MDENKRHNDAGWPQDWRPDVRTRLVDDVEALKRHRDEKCVTQSEFWPVKTLVYGLTGLLLMAVVGAILALVFQNKSTPTRIETPAPLASPRP